MKIEFLKNQKIRKRISNVIATIMFFLGALICVGICRDIYNLHQHGTDYVPPVLVSGFLILMLIGLCACLVRLYISFKILLKGLCEMFFNTVNWIDEEIKNLGVWIDEKFNKSIK